MARPALTVFFVSTFAFAMCAAGAEPESDFKKLQGEWQAVELEAEGKKAPPEEAKKFRIRIKGDEITFQPGSQERKAKFTLDPSKTPKAIDLTPQDGPGKGKAAAGIYSLEDGQLKLAVHNFGGDAAERPKEFKSQEGDGIGVITLKPAKSE